MIEGAGEFPRILRLLIAEVWGEAGARAFPISGRQDRVVRAPKLASRWTAGYRAPRARLSTYFRRFFDARGRSVGSPYPRTLLPLPLVLRRDRFRSRARGPGVLRAHVRVHSGLRLESVIHLRRGEIHPSPRRPGLRLDQVHGVVRPRPGLASRRQEQFDRPAGRFRARPAPADRILRPSPGGAGIAEAMTGTGARFVSLSFYLVRGRRASVQGPASASATGPAGRLPGARRAKGPGKGRGTPIVAAPATRLLGSGLPLRKVVSPAALSGPFAVRASLPVLARGPRPMRMTVPDARSVALRLLERSSEKYPLHSLLHHPGLAHQPYVLRPLVFRGGLDRQSDPSIPRIGQNAAHRAPGLGPSRHPWRRTRTAGEQERQGLGTGVPGQCLFSVGRMVSRPIVGTPKSKDLRPVVGISVRRAGWIPLGSAPAADTRRMPLVGRVRRAGKADKYKSYSAGVARSEMQLLRRTGSAPDGAEPKGAGGEATRQMMEGVQRIVRKEVGERMGPGSSEVRRLKERIYSDLGSELVLERERLRRI